ncbi:MAG: hypothetical protein F6K54_27070 [Okeania sp. SIO3B5]|uniref:hypothetical protein n=1 Tax=Okeania sp. SIO3B5 TaxID=2607811 RepID=UPI0013FEB9F0|nr:hypothetical protein [Okeania sp. SIO3B5]NEO56425.1 hypothetical protein [Okeania sp. SIO3B5]
MSYGIEDFIFQCLEEGKRKEEEGRRKKWMGILKSYHSIGLTPTNYRHYVDARILNPYRVHIEKDNTRKFTEKLSSKAFPFKGIKKENIPYYSKT